MLVCLEAGTLGTLGSPPLATAIASRDPGITSGGGYAVPEKPAPGPQTERKPSSLLGNTLPYEPTVENSKKRGKPLSRGMVEMRFLSTVLREKR